MYSQMSMIGRAVFLLKWQRSFSLIRKTKPDIELGFLKSMGGFLMTIKRYSMDRHQQNRYRGHMNRVNGAFFEYIIEGGCQYYRNMGIADIEKTPEPMRPIKDMGGGKFLAYFQKAAQPDFKGILKGGKAVLFEAKHTDTVKMDKTRVTSEQAQRLANAVKLGAEAFVLCSFGESGLFYRVPWVVWTDMKNLFGRKYVTAEDLKEYRIKIGGPGVLMFLDGLKWEDSP